MKGLTQHLNRYCEALPKQSRIRAIEPGLLRSARKDRPMGYASASVDEKLGFALFFEVLA
ncbi:MAG: hypothetical protein Q7S01_02200 [bacterium]|nr:hypothetical protein [bacterium]